VSDTAPAGSSSASSALAPTWLVTLTKLPLATVIATSSLETSSPSFAVSRST
jgi:hypothetical protein